MAKDLNLKVTLAAIDKATGPFKNIGRGAGSLGEQFKKTRENLKGLQAQQKDISSFREVKDSLVQNGAAMVANRDRLQALSREMASTATPSKALTREFQSASRLARLSFCPWFAPDSRRSLRLRALRRPAAVNCGGFCRRAPKSPHHTSGLNGSVFLHPLHFGQAHGGAGPRPGRRGPVFPAKPCTDALFRVPSRT